MLAGVFQLLQAKQNELNARRDSIDAQRDYWVARTNFERALSGVDSGEGRGFMPATTRSQGKPAERGGGH